MNPNRLAACLFVLIMIFIVSTLDFTLNTELLEISFRSRWPNITSATSTSTATPALLTPTTKEAAATTTKQTRPKTTYHLLTYNIFIRPPGIKTNLNDYQQERLDQFIEEKLPHFDLVCLQEMFAFGSHRRQYLVKRARALGFHHHVASPRPYRGFGVDGGLVCLSRLPIVQKETITYTQACDSDKIASKGGLYSKILVSGPSGKHLHVFSTHLQASYDTRSNDTKIVAKVRNSIEVRKSQIIELCNFILGKTANNNSFNGDTDEIVIMGDMNIDARHDFSEYAQLISCFKRVPLYEFYDLHLVGEYRQQLHPATVGVIEMRNGVAVPMEVALTAPKENNADKCLDYIFILRKRQGVSPLRWKKAVVEPFYVLNKPYSQLSDHCGVAANFSLALYNKAARS